MEKPKLDPYADWEVVYQDEIHRVDELLGSTIPFEDRVGDSSGGVSWKSFYTQQDGEDNE